MPPLSCPNPVCSFLFDPSQVPTGAILACPKCGTRFGLGESVTPNAPRSTPQKSDGIKSSAPGLGSYLLPVIGVMVVIAGVLIALILLGDGPAPIRSNDIRSESLNFAFTPPGEPWTVDEETKTNRLGVNVAAFRRTGPDAWVALAAKDYGDRVPRPLDLDTYAEDRLRRVFENLQKDEKPTTTWAGQPARRFEFRATAKGTDAVFVGECIALTQRGIGYWFFAWAGQRDVISVHEEFEPIRERLTFLAGRTGWREVVPIPVVLSGSGGYAITDREGVWTKPARKDSRDEDPKADLIAEATDGIRGPATDTHPSARLVTFLLDRSSDPTSTARKYVEARHDRDPESFGPVKFEELTDDGPESGKGGGVKPIRLKMTRPNSPTSATLVVVAGIEAGGKIVAVELSCPFSQRAVWEDRLVALAASLSASQ